MFGGEVLLGIKSDNLYFYSVSSWLGAKGFYLNAVQPAPDTDVESPSLKLRQDPLWKASPGF